MSAQNVDFGVGISMPVLPEQRERAEKFLGTVLGCVEVLHNESYTCFRFPNGQVIGITPDENALSEQDYERSTWLEIVTDEYDAMKKKIQDFGVREVAGGTTEAYFFNLPGGAVFRLLSRETAKRDEASSGG